MARWRMTLESSWKKYLSGRRLIITTFLSTLILRSPTIFTGFYNPDETYYATIGQRLLEGCRLYSGIIDHKPPIIYYLYSFFVLIGGYRSIFVAHAANVIIVSLTAITIYAIVKKLKGNLPLAGISALLYVVCASLGKPNDVAAANAELIFNLPLSLHILLAIMALNAESAGKKIFYSFLCGIAAALAVLVKLHAAIVPVATSIYFIYKLRKDLLSMLRIVPVYLLSLALPFLLMTIGYYHLGRLNDVWYWMVKVNFLYMAGHDNGAALIIRFLKQTVYMLFLEGASLWIPIILWSFLREKKERLFERNGLLIGIWLLASLIAVFPGGRFYGHYYLQILPPAVIVGAAAGKNLLEKFALYKKWLLLIWTLVIIVPLVHSWVWALPIDRYREKLEVNEFKTLVEFLKTHTRSNEQIEVWGRFNGVPFLVERKNGTRFLSKHFLSGSYRGKELVKMPDSHWEMYLGDLKKNRPEWFVDISYINMPGAPISKFPQLSSYISKNYEKFAEVEDYVIYRRK